MPDTATESILADLNEPQRDAVLHRDGPLLVLAGPGSGKTRVITRRAAHLVAGGVHPRNILAITFTNKAADEMRRRIDELGAAHGMWVHTFHALGARLLREFGPLGHVQPGFTIYDEADQLRVIKNAMEICSVDKTEVKPELVSVKISSAKNKLEDPAAAAANANYFDERTFARLYEAYEQLMRQQNAVDFDDLLMRVALVLRDNPEITEALNRRFQYVLIDEYQDTNHAQYLIASYLARHHRNICATGDPDQSIYGWRGADLNNILEFEHDYPDAKVVRLEQNYRSTPAVLRAASGLIRGNLRRKHKDLWTQRPEGQPVQVWRFAEGRDEAEHIADRIDALHERDRAYSDIAICYRVNAISRGLEEALRHRGIPYKIARGLEFYNRREIRDTLAYLRLLVNPADDVAVMRVINTPARKIGKTTLDRLRAAAQRRACSLLEMARNSDSEPRLKSPAARLGKFAELIERLTRLADGPIADAVSTVLEETGLEAALRQEDLETHEDRLANAQELVTAARRYEDEIDDPSLADFLQRVSLTSDQDAVDQSAGVVLLMTLHAAKGLEFPVVFICGLEQGMLPHERAIQADGDIEEERRLMFVGVTRAMDELYISHADERLVRGVFSSRCKSQFLAELSDDAVEFHKFSTAIGGPFSPARRFGQAGAEGDFTDEDQREAPRRARGHGPHSEFDHIDDEPVFSPDDPTIAPPITEPASDYADWVAGNLVRHESYGVGEIQWIRPAPGQTRASIKFLGHGPKVFILERAPIRRLSRKP